MVGPQTLEQRSFTAMAVIDLTRIEIMCKFRLEVLSLQMAPPSPLGQLQCGCIGCGHLGSLLNAYASHC